MKMLIFQALTVSSILFSGFAYGMASKPATASAENLVAVTGGPWELLIRLNVECRQRTASSAELADPRTQEVFRIVNPRGPTGASSAELFPYDGGDGPQKFLAQVQFDSTTGEVLLRGAAQSLRLGTIVTRDGSNPVEDYCKSNPNDGKTLSWFVISPADSIQAMISTGDTNCAYENAAGPGLDGGFYIKRIRYSVSFVEGDASAQVTASTRVDGGSGAVFSSRAQCEADTRKPW